jgi:hypothetical protein
MLLVTLPPFATELLAALVGAVAALAAIRRKRAAVPHDPEAEIKKLTERVRFEAHHPIRARFSRLFRA